MAAGNIPASVPAIPTLSLTPSSITVGSSTTIAWSSANSTGCTASGNWSGVLASTGSQTIAPSAVGTDTYTLACANAAGSSAATSVTLSVKAATPAATSSGGGGAISVVTLLGLAGVTAASRRNPNRRSQ